MRECTLIGEIFGFERRFDLGEDARSNRRGETAEKEGLHAGVSDCRCHKLELPSGLFAAVLEGLRETVPQQTLRQQPRLLD